MRGRWTVGVASGWLLGACAPLPQEEGRLPEPLPQPPAPPQAAGALFQEEWKPLRRGSHTGLPAVGER
jgi:hypothetical protein